MKRYVAGEKSKAICHRCKKMVETTFTYRDVPFSDGKGLVKDILSAVCDHCGVVVAIPAQSTPAIKAARETSCKPIEVRLAAPWIETLDIAAYKIDPNATPEFRKYLLIYYIHKIANSKNGLPKFKWREVGSPGPGKNASSSIAADVPWKRLSLKVTPSTRAEIDGMVERSNLNKTDLMKGVIRQIEKELVLTDKSRELSKLREFAAFAGG